MTTVFADHNVEGQALLLWGTLATEEWLSLLSLRLVTFADVELPADSSDRTLWRYVQAHGMLLLTANRSMRGPDSLEETIREENTSRSLPVITISNPARLDEKEYRQACAIRLVEIVLDLENYRGSGRVFIP